MPLPGDPDQPPAVRVSTDAADVDLDWLHPALSQRAYWSQGRTREVLERAVHGSLCFSAFDGGRQVGFARVVTDGATFGWVCDVFVDESARGQGIGTALLRAIDIDPRLQGVRLALATRDAAGLYRQFGFVPLRNPERWMERPRREESG